MLDLPGQRQRQRDRPHSQERPHRRVSAIVDEKAARIAISETGAD